MSTSFVGVLKRTGKDFLDDDCPRMAAAMSYFTIFSLPPLLLLILLLVGTLVEPAQVEGRLRAEMAGFVGDEGAGQIQQMIAAANRPENRGPVPLLVGIVALLLGATGALGQLQSALNRAWGFKPDPDAGGVKRMLWQRILSLAMVLVIALLLLVSLLLTAALSAFGDVLGDLLGGISGVVLQVLELVASLGLITVLFALIFKVLPDAKAEWRDIWVGAVATALLFVAGKYLIGLYLSTSDPGSVFGAAGALIVVLVWIYYSAMIVFLGAEFTQAWAAARGRPIRPAEDAVRIDAAGRPMRRGEGGADDRRPREAAD